MIKKYRNVKNIEKDSAFQEGNSALNNSEFLSEYGKMVSMVPKWNIETDKVDTWVDLTQLGGEQYDVDPYDELFNDLPH